LCKERKNFAIVEANPNYCDEDEDQKTQLDSSRFKLKKQLQSLEEKIAGFQIDEKKRSKARYNFEEFILKETKPGGKLAFLNMTGTDILLKMGNSENFTTKEYAESLESLRAICKKRERDMKSSASNKALGIWNWPLQMFTNPFNQKNDLDNMDTPEPTTMRNDDLAESIGEEIERYEWTELEDWLLLEDVENLVKTPTCHVVEFRKGNGQEKARDQSSLWPNVSLVRLVGIMLFRLIYAAMSDN